jgi:hypothetical protein
LIKVSLNKLVTGPELAKLTKNFAFAASGRAGQALITTTKINTNLI